MSAPQSKHKVLGLVSGGKDSCFNLLHCVANGHEVVALATLTPEPGTDELDSHLYQSVGTDLPPLIAESMGLPHYSRVIKGKSISQGPEYGDRTQLGAGSGVEGDETEDLYLLLQDVLEKHPDITAISTGAILSTYQRLRIEHVAGRLGLVSLAYLWQAEQLPLLEQMRACGMEVILVKVAGVGLGADLMGKSLWEALPTLRKLERMYGSHPAGEGGEYETLTLSSPLTSSRLHIVDSEVIVTDPEPNLVAYLKIRKAELVSKSEAEVAARLSTVQLRAMLGLPMVGPDGKEGAQNGTSDGEGWLDGTGREALEELQGEMSSWKDSATKPNAAPSAARVDAEAAQEFVSEIAGLAIDGQQNGRSEAPVSSQSDGDGEIRFAKRGRWFAISTSAASPSISQRDEKSTGMVDVGQQMRYCFDGITSHLASLPTPLSLPLHATHITLLLPSMALFPAANAAYVGYFGISPPSRATVAVPLSEGSEGVGLRVEVVGYDDTPLPTSISEAGQRDLAAGAQSGSSGQAESGGERKRVGGRSALHVQSLSYWAPANIGPYSQAITVNERIHIAGQIPLLPPTLTLPFKPTPSLGPSGTATAVGGGVGVATGTDTDTDINAHTDVDAVQLQATLALQHVRKIITVLRSPSQTGGGWEGWVEGCVAWWALPAASIPGRPSGGSPIRVSKQDRREADVVGRALRIWVEQMSLDPRAPLIIVRALELPKGAEVEVQMNLHTGRRARRDQLYSADECVVPARVDAGADDGEEDDADELGPVYVSGTAPGLRWETYRAETPSSSSIAGRRGGTRLEERRGSRAAVFVYDDATSSDATTLANVPGAIPETIFGSAVAVRVYHLAGDENAASRIARSLPLLSEEHSGKAEAACLTYVPVLDIHDRNGRPARFALDVFGI